MGNDCVYLNVIYGEATAQEKSPAHRHETKPEKGMNQTAVVSHRTVTVYTVVGYECILSLSFGNQTSLQDKLGKKVIGKESTGFNCEGKQPQEYIVEGSY